MNNIFKIASNFEMYVKATLKEDLAKRMLLGFGDYLGILDNRGIVDLPDGTSRRVDIVAMRDLIPQAKKILKNGVITCIQELNHIPDQNPKKYFDIRKEVEDYYKKDNINTYEKTLEKIIYLFDNVYFNPRYGGINWLSAAKSLLKILNIMNKAVLARKNNLDKQEVKLLFELMTEINIFEGIVHNTGGVLNKMQSNELSELDESMKNLPWNVWPSRIENIENDLSKLMNVKELKNPKHVLQELYRQLRKNKKKERNAFTDYLDRASEFEGNEDIHDELNQIESIKDLNAFASDLKNSKFNLNKLIINNNNYDEQDLIKLIKSYIRNTFSDIRHCKKRFNLNISKESELFINNNVIDYDISNIDYLISITKDIIKIIDEVIKLIENKINDYTL